MVTATQLMLVLSHVIQYLNNLHFKESDLEYLKETCGYDDEFIDYLRNLKLKLTIRSASRR